MLTIPKLAERTSDVSPFNSRSQRHELMPEILFFCIQAWFIPFVLYNLYTAVKRSPMALIRR